MQIRQMTATFGKLHNDQLTLSSGLNLIYAPNESGKSTWVHFLRTMLYGLSTRDRGPMADKNRFAPWDGSAMQGRMDIRQGDTAYTITRTTRRANSPMGEFRCTYADTATEAEGITGQNCGEYFLGIPREVFERSAFIGQNALAVGHNSELERRIASLMTTGQEDVSYGDSYDRLKKQLNHRRANSKVGKIPALEREIDALTQRLATMQELEEQAEAVKQRLTQLQAQRKELLAQQTQWEAWDAQQLLADYTAAQEAAQTAENRAVLLRKMTDDLPDEAALALLSQQTAAATENQHALEQAQQSAQQARQAADIAQTKLEAHALYPRTEAQLQQKRAELLPPTIPKTPWLIELLCALGGLLAALLRIFDPDFLHSRTYILIGISIACILAAGSVALWHRLRAKKLTALAQQRTAQLAAFDEAVSTYHALQKDADIALDRAQRAQSAAKTMQREQQERTLALLWQVRVFQSAVTDLAGMRLAIAEASQLRTSAAEAQQQAEHAALRCRMLRQQLPSDLPTAQSIIQPALTREQTDRALQSVETDLTAARTRLDMLTGQLRTWGDRNDLATQRGQLETQLTRLRQEYDALALAMEVLSQANTTLQNRFSPALGQRSAEIFRQLTLGKYDKVLLSRDFSLSAESADDPAMHGVEFLSQGAADQLYLAVRLAICDMVLPEENAAPLILDDALMSFDDERLHAALDYLLHEGEKRQIILFTCQKREQDYLCGRKGVTCLTL